MLSQGISPENESDLHNSSYNGFMRTSYKNLYPKLNEMATQRLRKQFAPESLDAPTLVHESFLKIKESQKHINDEQHLLALSSITMQHIILDHYRNIYAKKRSAVMLSINDTHEEIIHYTNVAQDEAREMVALLKAHRPRWGKVVECKFYEGLTYEETAAKMNISLATVKRDWLMAKEWMHLMMTKDLV
jgi:RNA polymerase sigma factor (TIGR02999 family)